MKISQREARRLRKRVAELERAEDGRRSRWANDYPGGWHVDTINVNDTEYFIIKTARTLGHACVVRETEGANGQHKLLVYALPLPKVAS